MLFDDNHMSREGQYYTDLPFQQTIQTDRQTNKQCYKRYHYARGNSLFSLLSAALLFSFLLYIRSNALIFLDIYIYFLFLPVYSLLTLFILAAFNSSLFFIIINV